MLNNDKSLECTNDTFICNSQGTYYYWEGYTIPQTCRINYVKYPNGIPATYTKERSLQMDFDIADDKGILSPKTSDPFKNQARQHAFLQYNSILTWTCVLS